MFELRKAKIYEILKNNNCSGCLVTDIVDVEYISGFKSSNVAVLITLSRNILFSDFRYKTAAEKFVKKNAEWEFILVQGTLIEAIGSQLKPGTSIGFQSEYMTVDFFSKLKKACNKVVFTPLADKVTEVFVEKSTSEIKAARQAARIADDCFAEFLELITPDMTEREAASELDKLCLGAGSESAAFDTIVLSGPQSALPHGRPGNKKLLSGNFIVVDFGCKYKGFCSDMTRTIVFGAASERMKKIYSVVYDAQMEACSKARSGMFTDELDAVARSIIEKHGFGSNFGHGLGHGVGIRIHESPRISAKSHVMLIENSIITIEPGIYISGFGGVRIEDMVRVTKTGIEIISKTPKELIIL